MTGFLNRPGGTLYYEVTGKGPALIFSHGLGGNYMSWWQQVPFFSKKFTCITYSHRGFWPNAGISEVPSISVFTDDLAALIEHLGLKSFSLVAQSFGGWVCVEYARQHQEQVRGMVMASTTGTLNFSSIKHPQIERLPEWKEWTDKKKEELLIRGILPGAGNRIADEQPSLYYLFEHFNTQTPREYREALRPAIHKSRTLSPEQFSTLKTPMLFVTGEEDLLFPPAAAEAAASLIEGARWESIPNTGHSTYFESPHIFNLLVDTFLSALPR